MDHFQRIHELIRESQAHGPLVETEGLTGLSGDKVIGTLQRLARYQEEIGGGCYLEIGVAQGLTLLSAAKVLTDTPAFGVDNYQFEAGNGGKARAIVEERIQRNKLRNVHLIESDYEDALEDLEKYIGSARVGTYFVDGPHDYRSQLIALQLARRHLSESAVVVVDDCNYRHVRLASRDFLVANPDFKLLFEAYTERHPRNMAADERERARRGWWNGVQVIVRDPEGVLDRMYPPTERDRTLHMNEHAIHSTRHAALAPAATALVSAIVGFRFVSAARQCVRIFKARRRSREWTGRYASMNTFSENLPRDRVNPSLGVGAQPPD